MNKAYRHVSLARDEYLGRVDEHGTVFEERFGPDRRIGRVDPGDGTVFEARLGPDRVIGRVELNTGKVFLAKFGPDEYVGKVYKDGRCFYHRQVARDLYLGRVKEMVSFAHGGAAFLLLIFPAYEEKVDEKEVALNQERKSLAGAPEEA